MVDRNLQRAQRAAGAAEGRSAARHPAAAQLRLPVPGSDRAERRRGPTRGVGSRRALRHRVGPAPAGVVGAYRDGRGPGSPRRPGARLAGDLRHRSTRRPRCARGSTGTDLHPEPPQPSRHRPDDPLGAGHVAPQARGRRGCRLLLRQEVEGDTVGAVAQRHPDRSRADRAQVVRPDQGPRSTTATAS